MVEGYAIHRETLEQSPEQMDPRIAERLLAGGKMSGPDYYDVLRYRDDLMARTAPITSQYDAMIMPTLPIIAPPIDDFLADDAARRDPFIIVIRNPSIANLLGRCALTIPCHRAGEAPVGFMLMGEGMADKRLLGIGRSVEALISPNI
jgi:aspartyl-tRNA(Asn)/glutamyl-tRNA(Gln) amidotransferase subunit A